MLGGRSGVHDEELESLRRFPEIGREETLKNEDQPIGRRRMPMKIRAIIAAACAAFAFPMASPIYAQKAKRKPSRRTSTRPFPISLASR